MTSLDRDVPEEWQEIQGFRSPIEFGQFQEWLAGAVEEGVVKEVPVRSRYSGSFFDEHWYQTSKGVVWRLVAPDPPFRGVFELAEGGSELTADEAALVRASLDRFRLERGPRVVDDAKDELILVIAPEDLPKLDEGSVTQELTTAVGRKVWIVSDGPNWQARSRPLPGTP